jgi:hypothetical protein
MPIRPCKVIVEHAASSDPRWTLLQADISAFLSKVERGEDLRPHLSSGPHKWGYTPQASGAGPDVHRWADKDMVLNTMGYHHFHPRSATRSNVLLFAHVTRDEFTVVAIFDHSVFEKRDPGQPLTAEHERLWQIFDERATRDAPPNSVVVPTSIGAHLAETHRSLAASRS